MVKVTMEEANKRFNELVEYVRQKHEAVVVACPSGESVQIVPLPQPVADWKGRPVYKIDDVQFLNAPWWFE